MPKKCILDPSIGLFFFCLYFILTHLFVVGKFLSLNVRDISNFRKSRTIFTSCKRHSVNQKKIETKSDGGSLTNQLKREDKFESPKHPDPELYDLLIY